MLATVFQWWTDTVPLLQQSTFPRLLLAMILGCIIGIERQWRQRAAGLRTNTLVCLGAAAFVDLSTTIGGPNNTNVIAYVVSGVGFLGAGAIIKDGASIRGLNTAATLWCSAAVGACAGTGELLDAIFVTVLLITINLALRPLSRFVDRHAARLDQAILYSITATCGKAHEAAIRSLCLTAIAERHLRLRQLRTESNDEEEDISLYFELELPTRDNSDLNAMVESLRTDPEISRVVIREGALESE